MTHENRTKAASLALLALATACGGASSTAASSPRAASAAPAATLAPQPPTRFETALTRCPMQLPNTELTAYPIDGGMALVFTTTSSTEELQRRARALGREYGPSPTAALSIPSRVEVVKVPGGARLDIRAVYEADVERMRAHLGDRARAMKETRSCPLQRAQEDTASMAAGVSGPVGSSAEVPSSKLSSQECLKQGGKIVSGGADGVAEPTDCPDGTPMLGEVELGVEQGLCCAAAQQPTAVP